MRPARLVGLSAVLFLSCAVAAPTLFGAATWLFGEVTLENVRGGTLGFVTEKSGVFLAAPTVHQTVELAVNGPLLRGRVKQRFHNPSAVWQEAVYLFPLPAGGAVDRLKMTVGNRVIEGRIKEKDEARRTYEKAKAEGKKAALAEQSRPDVFQMTLANIGPGEYVDVEMEYGQVLDFGEKGYALRFPLVVAGRYTPASVEGAGLVTGAAAPPPVPDAPEAAAGEEGPTVDLRVDLDAGFPLGSVACLSHDVSVQSRSPERREITLADGVAPADRDFILEWAPERGSAPRPAILTEAGKDGATYALALVLPPRAEDVAGRRLPRDTVLVVDTSGSMDGASMEQARSSLLFALSRLHAEDCFDVVDFDSKVTRLFGDSRPATAGNVTAATAFVKGLRAGGGTEMLAALQASLPGTAREGAVRQVVFITDGQVNDEERLFAFIEKNLGVSRLFTVGIGSAPNTAFMKRAAAGRGTFTFVGRVEEVEARMADLFRKLENPVLADVAVDWNAETAEVWPAAVPDLYADEPLVLAARLTGSKGPVKVTGRSGDQALAWELPLPAVPSHGGVGKLWAHRKVEGLLDSLRRGSPEGVIKPQVVAAALEHGLVTRYTSLVAVDVTPTRPEDAPTASSAVPLNRPAGAPEAKPRPHSMPSAPGPSGGVPAVPEPAEWLLLVVTLGIITWSVRRDGRAEGRAF